MAFTKATLTGAKDTIRAGWSKFNDLIDDLLSTSSGKGASQVGISDSAANMSSDNVEDALAEIYTDHSSTRTLAEIFDTNTATTTGTTWGYKAGQIRVDNTITSVSAGTLGLSNGVNYVEIDRDGNVSRNATGFTSGSIGIRQITVSGGAITVNTDKRAWFSQVAADSAASTTQAGVIEIATDAEAVTGTSDSLAMTPGTSTAQLAEPPSIGGTTPAAGSFTSLKVALGSDADGDIYYRASSTLARLAKGSANMKLFMNAAASAPEWESGFKVGSFQRNSATATGTENITTAGFKPSAVIFLTWISGTDIAASIGVDDGSTALGLYVYTASPTLWNGTTKSIVYADDAASKVYTGEVSAWLSNGFTVSWIKTGLPTGVLNVYYLAFR